MFFREKSCIEYMISTHSWSYLLQEILTVISEMLGVVKWDFVFMGLCIGNKIKNKWNNI